MLVLKIQMVVIMKKMYDKYKTLIYNLYEDKEYLFPEHIVAENEDFDQ